MSLVKIEKLQILCNTDILLWLFWKKKKKEKKSRNLIYVCIGPFAILVSPTHLDKNRLNVCLTSISVHENKSTHIIHTTFREVRFGIEFLRYKVIFARFRSHWSLKDGKNGNEPFSQEAISNVPIWERLFALVDIHSASHNLTNVAPNSFEVS